MRSMKTLWLSLCLVSMAMPLTSETASAQAPIVTGSATQPAKGRWIIREQLRFTEYGSDPTGLDRDIDELTALTMIDYGITGDWSVSLRLPMTWRDVESPSLDDRQTGLNDMTALAKKRFWREDTGPTDTSRASLYFGAEFESPDSDFDSGSVNPILGVTATHIRGRHGFGAEALWMFTTDGGVNPVGPGESTADWLRAGASYLYRISPEEYDATSLGSWYATTEITLDAETNGDLEVLIAPGIMYEARSWTFEAAVLLPLAEDLEHRPETDFGVIFGLRFLF